MEPNGLSVEERLKDKVTFDWILDHIELQEKDYNYYMEKLNSYHNNDEESVYMKLSQKSKRINQDVEKSKKYLTNGYQSIFLFGATKVGKSTIANAIVNGSGEMQKIKGQGVQCKQFLQQDGERIFAIGKSGVNSTTQSPGMYVFHEKKINLVDCPGLQDANQLAEYQNVTAIIQSLRTCSSCKLVLVLKVAEFDQNTLPLQQELHKVSQLFDLKLVQDDPKTVKDFILQNFWPVFVKGFLGDIYETQINNTINEVLLIISCKVALFDNLEDGTKECQKAGQKPDYIRGWQNGQVGMPKNSTAGNIQWYLMLWLMEALQKNMRYVDALDREPEEQLKQNITCAEMLDILSKPQTTEFNMKKIWSSDIPEHLIQNLENTYYYQMTEDHRFKQDGVARDVCARIYIQIFSPYQGPNAYQAKKLLINKIQETHVAQYSKVFKWFESTVLGMLLTQARQECEMTPQLMRELEDFHFPQVYSKYPVIFMLCHIFKALKKKSASNTYTEKDWVFFVNFLVQNMEMYGKLLEKEIEVFPGDVSTTKTTYTMRQGINALKNTLISIDDTEINEQFKMEAVVLCSSAVTRLFKTALPQYQHECEQLTQDRVNFMLDPEKKYTQVLIQAWASQSESHIIKAFAKPYALIHEPARDILKFTLGLFRGQITKNVCEGFYK